MKKYIGLLLVLAALVAVVWLLAPLVGNKTAQSTSPVVPAYIEATTSVYTINETYPVFNIPAADALVQQKVQAALADFKTYPPVPHGSATVLNTFTGLYQHSYVGSDFVSVELIFSEYTGGAHPITAFVPANVNLESGKELTLNDALALTGMTLAQVAVSAKAQLQASFPDGFIFPDGADPTPDNYATFLVGTSSVNFIFQDYQVAPYVYGPQYVSIPRLR